MKRLLTLLIVCLLTSGLANGMAMINFDKPVSSIMLAAHYDYNWLGSGKHNWSGLIGYAKPATENGQIYLISFAELGHISKGDELKLEVRGLYFLKPPTTGFNVGLLFGAGGTWDGHIAEPLTSDQTIAYLLGTTGITVSKPISNLIGLWGGFEFQLGADYAEYRWGAGINLFL
jgi:hypothetical protein